MRADAPGLAERRSPLSVAAAKGLMGTVQLLLDCGAGVDLVSPVSGGRVQGGGE